MLQKGKRKDNLFTHENAGASGCFQITGILVFRQRKGVSERTSLGKIVTYKRGDGLAAQ